MNEEQLQQKLARFFEHPAEVMNERIVPRDQESNVVDTPRIFSGTDLEGNAFVRSKDEMRMRLKALWDDSVDDLEDSASVRAAIGWNDQPEDLVDEPLQVIRSLEQMETRNLMSKSLAESPWSDSYWPLYQGCLGARYADAGFPSSDFASCYRYYQDNPPSAVVRDGGSAIDNLSPSEKYDLLVNDANWTLTQSMWSQGLFYYKKYGRVEEWMGICHGWAPAAYKAPRPIKKVVLPLQVNGRSINLAFYPADIKALLSLLWAQAPVPTRFVGGRCNDKQPQTDANGRVISNNCFDTNPGAWHMAIVCQIGKIGRSFVLDATYDYEVWNQPAFSYRYAYFNPQTRRAAGRLQDAVIPLSSYTNDKFKNYRSRGAVSCVGISMEVSYVVESSPNHAPTDSPGNDRIVKKDYLYDIELDAQGRIIGGEWYTNLHPDFLWTPDGDVMPQWEGESSLGGGWEVDGPVPASWTQMAKKASMSSIPLAKIVYAIARKARS